MCRFWSKVDKSGECWEWTAGKNKSGYGRIWFEGSMKYAHRVSWQLANGPIPDGMCVCHGCDNPGCVNPDHLSLGTQQINIADRVSKGRCGGLAGERHPNAKLTDLDVMHIMDLLSVGSRGREIARAFHVSDATISDIKTGRSRRKHV